jgi:hypothetical protein
MTSFKFLTNLLPVLVLAFFIVSCGGNTDTASDEATTDQTEQTEQMEVDADAEKQGPEYTSAYICPMHCEGSGSDKPGECPVCGMAYVENEDLHEGGHDHDHDHGHDHGHEGHNH